MTYTYLTSAGYDNVSHRINDIYIYIYIYIKLSIRVICNDQWGTTWWLALIYPHTAGEVWRSADTNFDFQCRLSITLLLLQLNNASSFELPMQIIDYDDRSKHTNSIHQPSNNRIIVLIIEFPELIYLYFQSYKLPNNVSFKVNLLQWNRQVIQYRGNIAPLRGTHGSLMKYRVQDISNLLNT